MADAVTTRMAQGGDTLPSLMDVARREAHSELAMSPALLAFNRYQEQQREELKNPSALAAAREELKGRDKGESPGVEDEANVELRLEKLIGKRWKNGSGGEGQRRVAEARGEQAKLMAEGGVPAPSNSGRGSKSKRAASKRGTGPDGAPVPKRKPGRPRKVPDAQPAPGGAQLAPVDAQPAPGGAQPAPGGAARPRTTAATGGRVPVFVSAHQPHQPQPVGPAPAVRVTSLEGPLRPVPPGRGPEGSRRGGGGGRGRSTRGTS